MDTVPDFWRTEVYHALSVHFPIVLLLLATVLQVVLAFFSRGRYHSWRYMGTGLLVSGTIAVWIAIYTGSQADGIVSRKICDPTVLKAHENAAYATGYIFLAATMLNLLGWFVRRNLIKTVLHWGVPILLMVGSGYLFYTGHQGAMLVYQQAAGVYQPSGDCKEFE